MGMDIPRVTDAPPPDLTRRAGLTRTVMLVTLVAAVGFMGGVLFAERTDSPHNDEDFAMFWQAWDILDQEYYYGAPPDEQLVRSAIQGLLSATGDAYTFYVPPSVAEFDRQQTAGEFGGIGADVAMNAEGGLVIVSPYSGYPAAEAGLQPQDVIREVDERPLEGVAFNAAVALLRGEIGTDVTLTVYRPSEEREFSVTLTRVRVELPTVDSRMIETTGYARLYTFNGNATTLLEDAVSGLIDQGAEALILDLRGNPGGLLDQAVGVSDLFLGDGVVVKQRSRSGQEIIYRSEGGDLGEEIPLIVLVDAGSASASEVVAGAIRDRDRGILIGQRTYGKGSVQHVHTLRDQSQVHVTYALWFTPDETPIQDDGLAPDIEIEPPTETDPGEDPALDRAIEYAQTELLPGDSDAE